MLNTNIGSLSMASIGDFIGIHRECTGHMLVKLFAGRCNAALWMRAVFVGVLVIRITWSATRSTCCSPMSFGWS